jgi:hypothetical protein
MSVDRDALRKDLRPQVRLLEDSLRERAGEVPEFHERLRREWQRALDAKRLTGTYETWLEGQVAQAAVGWVLGTVFVRFCEDNGLIDEPWIAGPDDDRLGAAIDREQAWYLAGDDDRKENATAREWMLEAFAHLRESSYVLAGLFSEDRNPLYWITPDRDAAKSLLNFWRQPGVDSAVIHDFTDEELDTRFLGNLYEDLSDHAKKTFALLQTPEFVEEFILDRTLTPALKEFGVDPAYPHPLEREKRSLDPLPDVLRIIDPTCGSGHFLIGAFRRLLEAWRASERSNNMSNFEVIARVLAGVHGVDKNPFAAEIARFRLLIEATKADEIKPLKDMPNWEINVAVGDSLLHGRGVIPIQDKLEGSASLFGEDESSFHTYKTEDVNDYIREVDILGAGSYHVVVGNPPYITVKDSAESDLYRERYSSCHRQYSLSVPFAERFFKLAVRGEQGPRGSGHVGQITANSFMKREFGKKLIEEFFWTPKVGKEHQAVNLTEVIDTSGAYIPGHGTPTVILVGRNTFPRMDDPIRAILGIRGESGIPDNPGGGIVWREITTQIDTPGTESTWISVENIRRYELATHPWSLSGGGADALQSHLNKKGASLGSITRDIGRTTVLGEEGAWVLPDDSTVRRLKEESRVKISVSGTSVRDYTLGSVEFARNPYLALGRSDFVEPNDHLVAVSLWPMRTVLRCRTVFGKTFEDRGLPWYAHLENYTSKFHPNLSITFTEVATHNHFVLDRGGKFFNKTAPIIKFSNDFGEDHYLKLLGLLNSSTACFWLKQVNHNKSGSGVGRGIQPESWMDRYQFNSTKLEKFPIPSGTPGNVSQILDDLAQELTQAEPSAIASGSTFAAAAMAAASYDNWLIRQRMIALQEELDWQVYGLYGLLDETEAAVLTAKNLDEVPEVDLGQRAFEIVMARKMAAGELETEWFKRHRSTPMTEIPSDWPEWYRNLVSRRIEKIASDRNIRLIEKPEFKRRWAHEPWKKRQKEALANYLLDACEDRSLWFDESGRAVTRTVYNLADALRTRPELVEAACLYAGSATANLANVLEEIMEAEHVPFIKSLRYKDSGLRKRAQWEKTWAMQREEDLSGETLDIPVPPKYTSVDFLKASYWRNRGKLDVAKERFISYPGANPVADDSLLIGWAGWDHRDQAVALTTLINERRTRAAWTPEQLTPLLIGLRELEFWLTQWHDQPDPQLGNQSPATVFPMLRKGEMQQLGLTEDDLDNWVPPKNIRRNRRSKAE